MLSPMTLITSQSPMTDYFPKISKDKPRNIFTVLLGARLGIIISMFMSGHLAYNIGWSSIFYVFGELEESFVRNTVSVQSPFCRGVIGSRKQVYLGKGSD